MYNWGVVVLKLGFFEVVSPAPNLLLYPIYLGNYLPPNPSYFWRFICWSWKIEDGRHLGMVVLKTKK